MKARSRGKPTRASAQRTRLCLLRAGRKAFAAKGLGGARLREDILVAAGVSAGSFYHQFTDKADLLAEVLRHDGEAALETLQNSSNREPSADLAGALERGRQLISNLFDMGDRHPEFVKIYVREYYSDSPAVRREIRNFRKQTIEALRLAYDSLREITGIPLDTEGIATLVSLQSSAIVNYYLGFPKKKRPQVREWLMRSLMQQAAGGIIAMLEAEDGPASSTGGEQLRPTPPSTSSLSENMSAGGESAALDAKGE